MEGSGSVQGTCLVSFAGAHFSHTFLHMPFQGGQDLEPGKSEQGSYMIKDLHWQKQGKAFPKYLFCF